MVPEAILCGRQYEPEADGGSFMCSTTGFRIGQLEVRGEVKQL